MQGTERLFLRMRHTALTTSTVQSHAITVASKARKLSESQLPIPRRYRFARGSASWGTHWGPIKAALRPPTFAGHSPGQHV